MKLEPVTIVRIYITEASQQLKKIIKYLRHDIKIRGVTVFRAIEGFGDSGECSAALVDLSLSLPLVIEFFDETTKVEQALEHLAQEIKVEHMVFWQAQTNMAN